VQAVKWITQQLRWAIHTYQGKQWSGLCNPVQGQIRTKKDQKEEGRRLGTTQASAIKNCPPRHTRVDQIC